uniref:Uncharacterized mitochondrial protein AtMg00810-like n=1 Tax=Nicotiana tabacum TaxID=4097 RepID=A0A1S3ZSW4_TOBAC|nr:PREDICTED: uncharacterized mitochondrial protein AtMg00810-like [Nicotiana tabacum]
MSTVKFLIEVVVKQEWYLVQLDVNNAFLHGDLNEEVYMKLPHGLSVSGPPALCYRGFTHSINDYSLFVMGSPGSLTILAIYVDDIILTGDEVNVILDLKMFLHDQFRIKDLGTLNYFLGIEIPYYSSGLLLNQKKFTADLLSEYACSDVSSVVCPLELHKKLFVDFGDLLDKSETYRSLIGRLLFLKYTRPDICFVVQHLSQFLKCPRVPHIVIALHILRYLKGSLDVGLFYSRSSDLTLTAYSDSD